MMVGEIDTKPIEPVQKAICLFGDRGDQKKSQPTRKNKRACEKEIEDLRKELANCKVQLEAKHAAHMQALLKLEHNQKKIHELSTLLKKSDLERNKHTSETTEGRACKDEIESKMKEIAEQNLETAKVRDQLSRVLSELKATQRELLNKETELVAARDSKLNALANVEQLKTALAIEKEQKEELLNQVKELNGVIHRSKLDAVEVEKEKLAILCEKDEKIELATKAIAQAQQQLEDMRKQIEMLQGLQSEPMDKSKLVDSFMSKLWLANEAPVICEDSASNDIKDSSQFHNETELKERKIMDQSAHIETLEMELNQLKEELISSKEEINGLNITIESLTGELQKAKVELNMTKERHIEAQVEIALLKAQLQEHRLAYVNGYPSQDIEVSQSDRSRAGAEERNSENKYDHITISMEDYKYLVREAEKANDIRGSVAESELASMKKELENASVRITELRARAEQALSRAELAEKAKAALEDKIARHREHRQRRKAALAALREESTPAPFSPSSSSHGTPIMQQPLGKVLNLKL